MLYSSKIARLTRVKGGPGPTMSSASQARVKQSTRRRSSSLVKAVIFPEIVVVCHHGECSLATHSAHDLRRLSRLRRVFRLSCIAQLSFPAYFARGWRFVSNRNSFNEEKLDCPLDLHFPMMNCHWVDNFIVRLLPL